jgi:bifunctional DNA-binding transcriptional regulator/antitoxin component of YhaV-PrlF toxin-antitoxin module
MFLYQKKEDLSGEKMSIGKVGSKGELFPPKKIREKIGLKEGQRVLYRIVQGKLQVEKITAFEEILEKQVKVKLSAEELKEERKRLSKEAEK